MKRIVITNRQKNRLLKEAMGDDFSLSELDSIEDFEDKEYYCNKKLGEIIGKGGTRRVYELNDNLILKLAISPSCSYYNKSEWETYEHRRSLAFTEDDELQDYKDDYQNVFSLFPICYSHADDWSWIITEMVLPIHKQDFVKVVGIPYSLDKKENQLTQWNPLYDKYGSSKSNNNEKYHDYKYDEYDDVDIEDNEEYAMYKRIEKLDNENFDDNFKPSVVDFLHWINENSHLKAKKNTRDWVYQNLVMSNKWLQALQFYYKIPYITKWMTKCFFRDNDLMDNFGLALRNGKPWIVVLDSGTDCDAYKSSDVIRKIRPQAFQDDMYDF